MKLTLALLALAALGTEASGQVVMSQTPTQKFALRSYAPSQSTADDLVLTAPTVLTGLAVWGTWTPLGASTTDTFEVRIHDNAVLPPFSYNAPGATLHSFSGLTPAVLPTGGTMPASSGPANPEYQLLLPLPGTVVLNPGHYWIEVYSNSDSGTGQIFEWEMAAIDPVAGSPCTSFSTTTPGVSWQSCTPFPEKEMALEVYGVSASGPQLDVLNLVSGSTATFNVSNATAGSPVLVAFSVLGGGSFATPFGNLLLTPPYSLLPGFPADGSGFASTSLPIQAGLTGISVWLQGFDVASLTLTWNGVATVIG